MVVSPAPSCGIGREAAGRAVDALLKWMHARAKQRKAQLLEHDDLLYLVLTVKRIPPTGRTNPYRIPLPHPLHALNADDDSSSATSVCLLVDDRPNSSFPPSAARARILSDSLPVADVIGLSDLRSDYRPFEARRRLCDSHDLFFADRRILPLLPRLLGKHFFKRKKIPLPVDLSRKGWPEQIRQCCASTLLYLRTGTCSGLKVGRVSQARDLIVDNVMAAIAGAVEHIPRKWANIRSLHIKSVDSLSLPIYQAVPELGLKIEAFQKEEEEPVEREVIQMEEAADKDEVKKKSLEGSSNKKKMRRIHEVLQYMDADPHYGGEDDDDGVQEDDGEEEKESYELGVVGKTKTKKKKKNPKVGAEYTKQKDKKHKKDTLLLSHEGTAVAGGVVNQDDDHTVEYEKASDKSGADKRTKKEKAGKDKKGKRHVEEDDGGGDGEGEKGSDEPGAEMRMKKKTDKDVVVKKEKAKNDKTGNRDGLMLSDEDAIIADGMRKKNKTKKLEDKDAKKIKRSKVRHETN